MSTVASTLLPVAVLLCCEAQEQTRGSVSLTPAKLTPELIERSEAVLKQYADAPVGTEVLLTIEGRRYVARLEVHEDDERGKHKGVTLYELE